MDYNSVADIIVLSSFF